MFGIFNNGEVCFLKQIDSGFENGNPIEAKTVESEPVPCHIVVNTDDKKGRYEDGKFQQYAYVIYMNDTVIDADIVKLTRSGEYLGDFVIQSVERGKLLNRVKIYV